MEKFVKEVHSEDSPEVIDLGVRAIPQVVDLKDAIIRAVRISRPNAKTITPYIDEYCTLEVNEMGGIELTNMDPQKGGAISMDTVTYTNDSSVEQSMQFTKSKEVTNSVSASLSLGFKYKSSYSAKVSLGKLFEGGTTQEFEFSVSATATVEKTVKETFTWDWPIKIPAKTEVVATALLSEYYRSPNFTQQFQIKVTNGQYYDHGGGFFVWVLVEEDGKQVWWGHTLGGWLGRLEEFEYVSPDEVHFKSQGKLDAVYGKDLNCRLIERRLDPKEPTKITIVSFEDNGASNIIEEDLRLEKVGNPDN
ncbi:MAG: hypothetical protein RIR11_4507 [Bacteroidota bacterium]|jgi:hypothetical protein